jgi:hypothetical protein
MAVDRFLTMIVVAAVALAAVAGLAGCSDSTHGEETTLKLIEPGEGSGETFGLIGKATKKGVEPGNGFAFSTPLQDPSSKKKVGELVATCIATKPSPGEELHGQCNGTAIVPGGTLSLNVGGDVGNKVTGAITGGTGKYAGATGTFTSVGENEQTDTYEITLP